LAVVNGVILIGVSTDALMAAFQDAMKKTILARRRKPGGPACGRPSRKGGGAGIGRQIDYTSK
jgi:hypothetical protein